MKKFFVRAFVILLMLFVAVYLPVRASYIAVKKITVSARAVSEALKNENLDDIRSNLKVMRSATDDLNGSLNFLIWMRLIPYVGGFYADAQHFSKAASSELKAAATITDLLEPDKESLGFTGRPTPGTDRVSQMVKVLDKVLPQLDRVAPELKAASDEVSSVDVGKYPDFFGHVPVKTRVETAKNLIMGINFAVTKARPALEIAPSALGEPTPKTYMLVFQNDKELRATGGFMTAYAFITLDKGHVSSTSSDDIYKLDEKLLNRCRSVICPLSPPSPIVKYLPEANGKPRTAWSMRDSNLSPDVPSAMQTFEKMYSYLPDAEKFDGIILIDTKVVEQLIKITGPIDVYGTTYSADVNKTCNCPDVVYELENYSQIIEKGEQGRKAVLGTLMQQILARSLGATTEKLPEFINTGIQLANSKDIIFYMHDKKTQQALSELNWTGQIRPFEGDYLSVVDSNFAGGKSNLYVTGDVTLEITTGPSDLSHHKLTITYKNPKPYGAWLNGINRNYVRVYVPQGSVLTGSKGSEVGVDTFEELGKTVFDAFVQVRPQNSLTLQFAYDVPKKFAGKIPLMVQKQPGSKDFSYVIKVNGVQKAKFDLRSDQVIDLPI